MKQYRGGSSDFAIFDVVCQHFLFLAILATCAKLTRLRFESTLNFCIVSYRIIYSVVDKSPNRNFVAVLPSSNIYGGMDEE